MARQLNRASNPTPVRLGQSGYTLDRRAVKPADRPEEPGINHELDKLTKDLLKLKAKAGGHPFDVRTLSIDPKAWTPRASVLKPWAVKSHALGLREVPTAEF